MKKLIPATLALTAVLAFSPAFAGETTITAKGETSVAAPASVKADAVVAAPAVAATAATGAAMTPATTTPADTATTGTTEEDATPEESKVESYILKDGSNVTVVDKKAFTVSADGTKTPVADGDIVTKDGVTLKVKDGMIVTDSAPVVKTDHGAEPKPAESAPMMGDKKPDAAPKE